MSSPIPNYTHTDVKREKNKKLKFQYKKKYWQDLLADFSVQFNLADLA